MPDALPLPSFNKRLRQALFVPIGLFVIFPVIGLLILGHLANLVRWDRHSIEVFASTYAFEKLMIDMETGIRGFQLTGDETFLEPYNIASHSARTQLEGLQELVADNSEQTHRLTLVRRNFDEWNAFAAEIIKSVRHGARRNREQNIAGKALMDRVRADLAVFLSVERRLLDERMLAIAPAKADATFWLLGLFAGVAGGVIWWTSAQMRTLASTFRAVLFATELEKERFRVTLASIGDAVIVTDRKGSVTFLNSEAERMTGWSAEEANGWPLRSIFRILNEESRQPADDPVEKVFKEQRVVGLANHTLLISKTGKEWMIEDSASPIFDAEHGVSGVVLVFQDATERRKAQKALIEARDEAMAASRAKDDFLATLSHELRTPLNPVLLVSSDNAGRSDLDDDIRLDFQTISKNIELEARLIDDLLDLTRIANRKLSVDRVLMDVRHSLRDALEKVSIDIAEKGVHLEQLLHDDPIWVLGDEARLQQVFWNVLKNAAKFTPAGGRVLVKTMFLSERRCVSVEISDTGLGLTRSELQRAFQPFAQGEHANGSTERAFGGLGLGLAIARSIVEMHSGTIEATSLGRGQGATFTIILPLVDSSPKECPLIGLTAADTKTSPFLPYRILLVEDDASTHAAMAQILRKRGCEVVVAVNVAGALVAAGQGRFDLVISDLGLPDGDGCELMDTLRQKYGLVGIATSGFGTAADVARTKQAGFYSHLTKPITSTRLESELLNGPWVKQA
jgi:PAS domain S-box-containing protein